MSGLDEKKWNEIEKGLEKVDKIHEQLLIMKTKLGYEDGNGLFGRVERLEKRPSLWGKWIPIVICIFLFCITIYDRVNISIRNEIIRQQVSITPEPTP